MTGSICGGGITIRRIMRCPTEDRQRRFVVLEALYYDPILTCCGCGDSWSTEGRMPRPFRRGWREQEIARATRQWAGAVNRAEASRLLRFESERRAT